MATIALTFARVASLLLKPLKSNQKMTLGTTLSEPKAFGVCDQPYGRRASVVSPERVVLASITARDRRSEQTVRGFSTTSA